MRLFSLLMLLSLMVGCSGNTVYEDYFEFNQTEWEHQKVVSFQVPITEPGNYNIYAMVRHTNEYNYSNLWMMLYTQKPDSSVTKQRFELTLAEPDGKWIGDGFGSNIDQVVKLRSNYPIDQVGNYIFSIQHDMRLTVVPSVKSVGLKLEKSEPKE